LAAASCCSEGRLVSVKDLGKAIKSARRALIGRNPRFVVLPAGRDAEPLRVPLAKDMRDELHAIAMTALQRADDLEQVDYDPDSRIERGEEVLMVADDAVNDESVIYDIVERLEKLKRIDARLLAEQRTVLYAVAFGTTPEDRIVFVRRKRVETFGADGGWIVGIAEDTLRVVREPAIVIDRIFDLIVFPAGVVAFDHQAFEKLVKDPADVSAEMRSNAEAVAEKVPFAAGLIDKLVARGETRPMIRRKLRSIVERRHLDGVRMKEIRGALRAQNRKPSDYVNRDDELDFDIADALFVLRFLDEGTWLGWRSKTLYAAGGRSVVK
jgi:hypothetical protein